MTIHTFLKCWLCKQFRPLSLELYDSDLGNPTFWCAFCTSEPRRFARLIRRRLADEADGTLDTHALLTARRILAAETEA